MRLTALNQLVHADERVDGVWRLTPRHELQYRRRGPHQRPEETVMLTGALVGTDATGLTLQVTGQQLAQDLVGHTVRLRGRWQADARHRLTFLIEREGGRADRLTLQGGWTLGPHHEIRYRYQRPVHPRGRDRAAVRTLTFAGAWELPAGRQLTYVLDAAADSAFRFRGTWQTPSILAKTGELRYQLGVEVAGRRRLQTLTFFGTWKVSRTLGVTFELPLARGRIGAWRFGATFAPGPGGTLTAALTARHGQPLGVEVVFTRELWRGSAEAFVRLRRARDATAVEAGLRGRW